MCEQHHWNICNVGELPTNTSKAYFNLCLQFIYQHIFASVQPRNLSQRPYIASSSKVAFPFIIESCLDGKKTAGLIIPSFTHTIFLFHGLCCFFILVLKLSYKQYIGIFPWTKLLYIPPYLRPVAYSPFFMNTPKQLLHLYILVKTVYKTLCIDVFSNNILPIDFLANFPCFLRIIPFHIGKLIPTKNIVGCKIFVDLFMNRVQESNLHIAGDGSSSRLLAHN